jgi:hypothetical protein
MLSWGGSTDSRTGVLTASARAPAARTRPVDGRDSEASEFGPGHSRESQFGAARGAAVPVVAGENGDNGNPGNIGNSVDHANTHSPCSYAEQKKLLREVSA